MSSSRQPGIPLLALIAMALPLMEAAEKQRAAKPAAEGSGPAPRDFLADLLNGKCNCPDCIAESQSNGEGTVATSEPASASNPEPSSATEASVETGSQAPQEVVRASGSVSVTACRAVNFTDADTGEAAQLKGSAAALITGLEDLRDGFPGGAAERITAEGHIGGIARACAWAAALQRNQPA